MRFVVVLLLFSSIGYAQDAVQVTWSADLAYFVQEGMRDAEDNTYLSLTGCEGLCSSAALIKIDSNYELLWGVQLGNTENPRIYFIDFDENQNVIFAGEYQVEVETEEGIITEPIKFVGKINQNGDVLWINEFQVGPLYGLSSLSVGGNGDIIITIDLALFETPAQIIGFNQVGDLLFERSIGGDFFVNLRGTISLGNNLFFSHGQIPLGGELNPFVGVHSSTEFLWATRYYHATDHLSPTNIIKMAENKLIATGSTTDFWGEGNITEGYVIEFDTLGNPINNIRIPPLSSSNAQMIFSPQYIDDDQLLISRLESGDNFVQYGVVLLNEDLDVIWAKDIMGEEFTFSALRGFSYPGKAAVAGTSPNGHFFLNVFDTSGVTACDLDSVEVESFIYEDLIIDDITNFLSLEELNSYQEHSFLTFSEISFEEIDFCSQTLSSELVEESSQFKISPNPATSSVSITSSQDIESVQILRLDGAFAKKFNGFDANRELDISDLSEGLYLVKIYTEEKVHSERLVKL